MAERSWRDSIDKNLKLHLEAQINATIPHKGAYSQAKNSSTAQLWIAIANLSRQVMDLTIKNRFLENALRETLPYAQKHSVVKGKKAPKKKKKTTKKVVRKKR